jgi:hypothetical protein
MYSFPENMEAVATQAEVNQDLLPVYVPYAFDIDCELFMDSFTTLSLAALRQASDRQLFITLPLRQIVKVEHSKRLRKIFDYIDSLKKEDPTESEVEKILAEKEGQDVPMAGVEEIGGKGSEEGGTLPEKALLEKRSLRFESTPSPRFEPGPEEASKKPLPAPDEGPSGYAGTQEQEQQMEVESTREGEGEEEEEKGGQVETPEAEEMEVEEPGQTPIRDEIGVALARSVNPGGQFVPEIQKLAEEYVRVKDALKGLVKDNPGLLADATWKQKPILWAMQQSVKLDLSPADWLMVLLYQNPTEMNNLQEAMAQVTNNTRRTQQSLLAAMYTMIGWLQLETFASLKQIPKDEDEYQGFSLSHRANMRAALLYIKQFTTPQMQDKVTQYFEQLRNRLLKGSATEERDKFYKYHGKRETEGSLLPPEPLIDTMDNLNLNLEFSQASLGSNPAIVMPKK